MKVNVDVIYQELNNELAGLPAPVAIAKLILKIWDELTKAYVEDRAVQMINEISMDIAGFPAPLATARLANRYVELKMFNDSP